MSTIISRHDICQKLNVDVDTFNRAATRYLGSWDHNVDSIPIFWLPGFVTLIGTMKGKK